MRATLLSLVLIGCGGSTPPPAAPEPKPPETSDGRGGAEGPTIEYDLGGVDPNLFKRKVDALKGGWTDCYLEAHKAHETLEGKLVFTIRTNKDGSVKWAFVKESDLGDRRVEKCVIDSLKATNFGPPMDAREGEVAGHTVGWGLDDDSRPADGGGDHNVRAAIDKARNKIAACRSKVDAKGAMTATLYVAKGGKPISVGIAIEDPSADAAIDCVVEVLMGLKYVNKASWPVKVTTPLP
jgi:hypothetical protein